MIDSPYPWGGGRRPATAALVGLGLIALGLALFRRRPLTRVVVAGPSMLPTLSEGDRLLVRRTPVLERGDLVAFEDPQEPGRLLVKRLSRLYAEAVEVEGDNPGASRDSRHFGAVPRGKILGRAIYRYHPPGSVGRLSPPSS